MKQKVFFLFFFLLFFLFFLAYVYMSFMNPDGARLYIGRGRFYETTVANYVAVSFIFGVILSILASFATEIRRGFQRWGERRSERRKAEVQGLFEKAKLHEMKGEPDKAAEYIQRIIRSFPDMEEPYTFLAEMFIARKEFDKAGQVLDNAQNALGSRESILLRKVRVCQALKDTDGAERLLRELLKRNESNLEAVCMLRDLLVGRQAWSEALDVERRIRRQIKTADENQRLVGLQYERARELFERADEKLYDQIIKDLKEISDDDKHFVPAYILAADVYRRMGRLNDAGRVYARGFSKTGHVVFLQKMEDLYIQKGEPGVVLKIYERLLDVAPKNQFLIFLYAGLCLKLEMIDEAIDLLNSLMAEEKEFLGLHRAMAEAYIHRGEYENAAAEFSKAFPMSKVHLPFHCEKCQSARDEWADFCGTCQSWNTITIRREGLFSKEAESLRLLYEQEQDWEAS